MWRRTESFLIFLEAREKTARGNQPLSIHFSLSGDRVVFSAATFKIKYASLHVTSYIPASSTLNNSSDYLLAILSLESYKKR